MSLLKVISRRTFLQAKNVLPSLACGTRNVSDSTNLKDVMADLVPKKQKEVVSFRKSHGTKVIGEVMVDQLYGGMRGIKGLVTETSVLDPEEGIRFRGYTIPDCQEMLPKAPGGSEPLPEGLFWLLMTGEVPNEQQTEAVSKEWAARGSVPSHVAQMLNNFPSTLHPMSQFSAAITAMNSDSKFAQAYNDGVSKASYWEYAYEDAMDLCAKLTTVAATIYRNLYREGSSVCPIDVNLDWSGNFAAMLGYEDEMFKELMRLYLTIHR